jgi:hypothetical protein
MAVHAGPTDLIEDLKWCPEMENVYNDISTDTHLIVNVLQKQAPITASNLSYRTLFLCSSPVTI